MGPQEDCQRIAQRLQGDCLGSARELLRDFLLEASRSALEPSWSVFGAPLERLRPSWKRLGASLEPSLERLGASWKRVEASWRGPGAWFFKGVKIIETLVMFSTW